MHRWKCVVPCALLWALLQLAGADAAHAQVGNVWSPVPEGSRRCQ